MDTELMIARWLVVINIHGRFLIKVAGWAHLGFMRTFKHTKYVWHASLLLSPHLSNNGMKINISRYCFKT